MVGMNWSLLGFAVLWGQDAALSKLELTIDGQPRQALVHRPSQTPAPIVFVFHGHGGSMQNVAKSFHLHTLWPTAFVVYPQGLPTVTPRDPQGERPGWQHHVGTNQDRDLKLVDALLEKLAADGAVDKSRVFATGHSNGGAFTYLLWSARGNVFAALAPSASGPGQQIEIATAKPKPIMHLAGKKDPIVSFEMQQRVINGVLKVNECSTPGAAWGEHGQRHASAVDAHTVTWIFDGTHQFPDHAPAAIVKFFQSIDPALTKN